VGCRAASKPQAPRLHPNRRLYPLADQLAPGILWSVGLGLVFQVPCTLHACTDAGACFSHRAPASSSCGAAPHGHKQKRRRGRDVTVTPSGHKGQKTGLEGAGSGQNNRRPQSRPPTFFWHRIIRSDFRSAGTVRSRRRRGPKDSPGWQPVVARDDCAREGDGRGRALLRFRRRPAGRADPCRARDFCGKTRSPSVPSGELAWLE
jgi:hypothetical protein